MVKIVTDTYIEVDKFRVKTGGEGAEGAYLAFQTDFNELNIQHSILALREWIRQLNEVQTKAGWVVT